MAPLLSRTGINRYRLRLVAATAIGLGAGMSSQVSANPFGSAPVSDRELSSLRGGFELPNGMNVAVAVEIETRVDGALALRTVLNLVDTAEAALQIFASGNPQLNMPKQAAAIASANPAVATPSRTAPAASVVEGISQVPEAAIAQTSPSVSSPAVSLTVNSSASPTSSPVISAPAVTLNEAQAPEGPQPVSAHQVQSDFGAVRVEQTTSGSVVILKGPDLEIQHLTGNSTGVLIANTLDNRAIDTIATVNVSLSDSAVPVGNILLRVESIVLDAVGGTMY